MDLFDLHLAVLTSALIVFLHGIGQYVYTWRPYSDLTHQLHKEAYEIVLLFGGPKNYKYLMAANIIGASIFLFAFGYSLINCYLT